MEDNNNVSLSLFNFSGKLAWKKLYIYCSQIYHQGMFIKASSSRGNLPETITTEPNARPGAATVAVNMVY